MNQSEARKTLDKLLKIFTEKVDIHDIAELITDEFEMYSDCMSDMVCGYNGVIELLISEHEDEELYKILKTEFSESSHTDTLTSFIGHMILHDPYDDTLPNVRVCAICVKEDDTWKVHNIMFSLEKQMYVNKKIHSKTKDQLHEIKTLMENVPGGVHMCRLSPPIEVVYVSDALCAMVEYTRSDISKIFENKYSSLIVEEDRQIFRDAIRDLCDYPHTVSIDYRLLSKTGRLVPVRDMIRSVRKDNGEMWAYAIVFAIEDDSEEKNWLKQVVQCFPNSIGIFSYWQGTASIEYCNDEFKLFLGYEKDKDISDTDPLNWVSDEDRGFLKNGFKVLENGANNIICPISIYNGVEKRNMELDISVLQRNSQGIKLGAVISPREETNFIPKVFTEKKVTVKTFGYFEVYVDGNPIAFQGTKTKELLAILIDRRGGYISSAEIISLLWEDEPVNKTTLSRCRKTMLRLVAELKEYGIANIVDSTKNGLRRVIPENVNCDLYNFLSGAGNITNMFTGSYMTNYSWGEYTLGELQRKANSLDRS